MEVTLAFDRVQILNMHIICVWDCLTEVVECTADSAALGQSFTFYAELTRNSASKVDV